VSEATLQLRMPVRDPDAAWIRLGLDHELFQRLANAPPIAAAIERVEGGSGHLQLAEKRRQLAASLRVTESVSPYLHKVVTTVKKLLRLDRPVELYVTPSPIANAFCMELPDAGGLLVVVTSGAVDLFTRGELLFLVGHELGHGILGHHRLPGSALLNPPDPAMRLSWEFTLELLRWLRAGEISADRFGLVCCQDPTLATRAFLKLASGLSGAYLGTGEDFDDQMEDWTRHRIAGEGLDQTHPLLPIRVRCAHAFAESDYFTQLFGEAETGRGLSMEGADGACHDQLALMDADPTHIEKLDHPEEVMGFLAMAGYLLAASDNEIGAVEYHWYTELVGSDLAERARAIANEHGYENYCREFFELGHGISEDLDRRECLQLLQEIGVIAAVDGHIHPAELQSLRMIGDALRLPSHLVDVAVKELGSGNDRRLQLRS
jgi:hypothetical protein